MEQLLSILSWLVSEKPLPRSQVVKLYNSIPDNIRQKLRLPKLLGMVIKPALDGALYRGSFSDWVNKYMIPAKDITFGTTDQKTFYDNIRKAIGNNSESARNKITKDVGKFCSSDIAKLFNIKLEDNRANNIKHLRDRVYQAAKMRLPKDDDIRIPMAVSKTFSDKLKKSQTYLDYKDALKTHTDYWKNWLQRTIRSSGEKTLVASDVYKLAVKQGLQIINMPTGFVGKIDENGKFYTLDDVPLFGGSSIGVFKLNPSYKPGMERPPYYGQVINPSFQSPQKMYTQESLTERRVLKETKTYNLAKIIDKVIAKWQRDCRNGNGIRKTLGSIVECLWETGGRIGSETGLTKGEKTYGISSLRVGHLKKLGSNKIQLKYKGKDGQLQTHILEGKDPVSKELVRYMLEQCEGKQKSDKLWDTDEYTINAPKVNQYFSTLGVPKGTTIHKLRHALATKIWNEQEPKIKIANPTTKTVEQAQQQIGESLGKKLGHWKNTKDGEHLTQWQTSLKNYCPVSLQKAMFDKYNVPYSKRLEQLLKDYKAED